MASSMRVTSMSDKNPKWLVRLRAELRDAFHRWCAAADSGAAAYRQAAPDDLAVFEKLRTIDLGSLEPTRWRRAGPWELQFNWAAPCRPPICALGFDQYAEVLIYIGGFFAVGRAFWLPVFLVRRPVSDARC